MAEPFVIEVGDDPLDNFLFTGDNLFDRRHGTDTIDSIVQTVARRGDAGQFFEQISRNIVG